MFKFLSKGLSSFREKLMEGKEAVLAEMNKVTKVPDLERVVGVYYMIGIADGTFDQSEKDSMMAAIKSNKALESFDDDAIMKAYKTVDGHYGLAKPMGDRKVLEMLKGAEGDFRTELMMFACIAGAADGDFDDSEKEAARRIAEALRVNPADFADFGL